MKEFAYELLLADNPVYCCVLRSGFGIAPAIYHVPVALARSASDVVVLVPLPVIAIRLFRTDAAAAAPLGKKGIAEPVRVVGRVVSGFK
jgi:hypothetical protein